MEGETKPASRRGAIAVDDCDERNAKQEDSAVDGLPPCYSAGCTTSGVAGACTTGAVRRDEGSRLRMFG